MTKMDAGATYKTGDIIAMRYKKPSFIQKTIARTCHSVTTHDELIVIDEHGVAQTGYAAPPSFTMLPLEFRKEQHRLGVIDFAIFRYVPFTTIGHVDSMWYEACQVAIRSSILTMADVGVKYDTRDVVAIGRNVLRAHIWGMKKLLPKREGTVYCTESVKIAFDKAHINLFAALPKQEFCSPIHVERAYYAGDLKLITDYGLQKDLDANKPV